MAITMANAKASVKTFFYKVYIRDTGTAIAAADYDTLAHWNTFLALFTYIGQCKNTMTKIDSVPSGDRDIDEGRKKYTTKDCLVEATYLQGLAADIDAIRVDLTDNEVDVLFVDAVGLKAVYVHQQDLVIEEHEISGDEFAARMFGEQIIPYTSDFSTPVLIPTA